MQQAATIIKKKKQKEKNVTYHTTRVVPRQCCVGTELVDWQMQQSSCVHSRIQAVGMWQVLLEEGVLNHGETPCDVCVCTRVRAKQRF